MAGKYHTKHFGLGDSDDLQAALDNVDAPDPSSDDTPSTPIEAPVVDAVPVSEVAPMEQSDTFPNTDLTLAYLTPTDTGIDNSPDAAGLANLATSALILSQLINQFGPLTIYSGYRNQAVNLKVGGSPTSYHMLGLAFDLAPSQGTIYSMFQAIVNGPWKNQLSEIFLKPSQGTLHLSWNSPTGKVGQVSVLSNETYRALTPAEQDYYLNGAIPTGPMPDDATLADDIDSTPPEELEYDSGPNASGSISPIVIVLGLIAVGAVIYMATQGDGKHSSGAMA